MGPCEHPRVGEAHGTSDRGRGESLHRRLGHRSGVVPDRARLVIAQSAPGAHLLPGYTGAVRGEPRTAIPAVRDVGGRSDQGPVRRWTQARAVVGGTLTWTSS